MEKGNWEPKEKYSWGLKSEVKKLNWGPKSKKDDQQFLKALLDGAKMSAEDKRSTFEWQNESSEHPQLEVTTERKLWCTKDRKDNSNKLSYSQLMAVIKRLEYLEIIITPSDSSQGSQGCKVWKFTLKLWSKDTPTNLSKFEQKHGKEYLEPKQGSPNNSTAVDRGDVNVEQSSDIRQQSIDNERRSTDIFKILNDNKRDVNLIVAISKAYLDTVPNGWFDSQKQAIEISDIWQQLKDIPHLDSNNSPILRFTFKLLKENIPQTIREKLNQVLANRSISFETNAESILTQRLHSYLLIIFRPTGTNELSVQACCIPGDTIRETDESFEPLTVEEQKVAIPFVPEKMYLLLSNLIKQCYENHIKGRSANLTIEIFLPSDRLYDEVEKWSYEDSEGMALTIGKEHMVVVRSYDRLKNSYMQSRTNWRNRWEEVQPSLRNILSIEQVMMVNEAGFDCNELRNWLVRKNVLMVSCELTNQQRKGLLKAIHSAGTPIVIWSRSEVQNLNNPKNFDALMTEPLHQLTAQVKQQRWEAKSDKDLGNHLVLLWDDPNRIPPRSIFEVPAS